MKRKFMAMLGLVVVVSMLPASLVYAMESPAEVETLAGTGYPGHMDGSFPDAAFFLPGGLYVLGDMLLVVDTGNNMVRRLDLMAVLGLLE